VTNTFSPICSKIKKDNKSAKILYNAYSGYHSELTLSLQYLYHFLYFTAINEHETAKTLKQILKRKFFNFKLMGNLIDCLGVTPIYAVCIPLKYNFIDKNNIKRTKIKEKMILDDIGKEMLSLNYYESMLLKLDNEEIISIIKQLKFETKVHIDLLTKHLNTFKK